MRLHTLQSLQSFFFITASIHTPVGNWNVLSTTKLFRFLVSHEAAVQHRTEACHITATVRGGKRATKFS